MVQLARARGIDASVGDVQKLSFPDASFDTAVAAWMLYHVPDINRGIAELARVLSSGGKLVAVTNSVHHLRELRDLIHYPAGREELFNRENGEEFLRRHFSRVQRHDADGPVMVRDRAKLVAYRDSLQVEVGPPRRCTAAIRDPRAHVGLCGDQVIHTRKALPTSCITHPNAPEAGLQVPAGTIRDRESAEQAVLSE
jgi:SAM-dependent methyltransferase